MTLLQILMLFLFLILPSYAFTQTKIKSTDLYRLRSVKMPAISADVKHIAYTVSSNPETGRTRDQLWILDIENNKSKRLVGENETGSGAVWSHDGKWIAFTGKSGNKDGLFIVRPDGSGMKFLAEIKGTNSPLTYEGQSIEWSPDSKRIAFVSTTPGPETAMASGDPVVITRYLYKPDYNEGMTRFNDNRRRHIFIVDVESGKIEQITSGNKEEHSIDWSPDGKEIVFVSNQEPDPDLFYNPDLFSYNVETAKVRRLTATESAEFMPQWSPDGSIAYIGTKRGLTDLETDMEDTHVWTINADGSGKKEIGAVIDNRQSGPVWAPDGRSVFTVVPERGVSKLYSIAIDGSNASVVIGNTGQIGDFSVSKNGTIAYTFISKSDLSQLYLTTGESSQQQLTDLNSAILKGVSLGEVESFTFVSNDFKYDVEAFLTKPVGLKSDQKYPLIVHIHGGPHGWRGPAFQLKAQCYAARGWATLMVNFRGSTSYGQKFSDAVFADQNGNEAQDVLYGTFAAMRRYLWIDRDRIAVEGWSYGGQLSAWLVTQTHIFKAAIPGAPIINNLSYNYTTYYNMYEQMEWGLLPHQGNMMDVLWERSALKHAAKVKTPVMLLHGENDIDVPITESEQFYIALKDVGVETVMVRYPREGHSIREPKHQVDIIDRSMAWFEKHFL